MPKSTERCPSRCVCVKIHTRARRLKFLCLDMLCVAQIRRRKNKPLRLNHKLEEILHWTLRAPVVLGGVEIVYREGRILNPSTILWRLKFLSPSRVWHGLIKVDHCDQKSPYCYSTCRQKNSQLVRILPKTALARATCSLGTHSSGISNPCGVVNAPEKKRASKMLHSRYG